MHARSPRSFSGVSVRFISTGNPLLEPVQHFILNPSHPIGAKLYPLGELAGCLQPCDVLWRVQDKLLQLPFRQNPHREDSQIESIAMLGFTTMPEALLSLSGADELDEIGFVPADRISHLVHVGMAIIDGGDTADRSRDVV